MPAKIIIVAAALAAMIASPAFADNGCPIGYNRIEAVNPNQTLVNGPTGNYLRTVANSDPCDNINLYGHTQQCCARTGYQSNSGGGGGAHITHQTANAVAAVAVVGIIAAVAIHEHNKKVQQEFEAKQRAHDIAEAQANGMASGQQGPSSQVAAADEPATVVVDGITYTKAH